MSAWNPRLNESVAAKNVTVGGEVRSPFNPFNFTDQPFFLGVSSLGLGDEFYAFSFVASCVFPTSGLYCPLNRWLFYTEIGIGLVALTLSYEWLSVISIAAALNYTAVGAIHAIILFFLDKDGTKYLDSDSRALYEILGTSVLLAHPLQQWSQTLQKKTFAKTRVILGFWSVLICVAFITTDRGLHAQGLAELAVIDNSAGLLLPSDGDLIDLSLNGYFTGTINPWQVYVTAKQWNAAHAQLRPCPTPTPTFTSALRRGQTLTPDVYAGGLAFNKSYDQLDAGFRIFFIFKNIATLGIAFHGQRSTVFIRANLYFWIRGGGSQASTWRHAFGVSIATLYHSVRFVLGMISIPVAFTFILLWEYPEGKPQAKRFTDIGQWVPWAGAALLAFAVILNTTSATDVVWRTLLWLVSKLANILFLGHVERPRRPRICFEPTLFDRLIGFPGWIALFFIDEYLSTRDWLRDPYEASLACILEETNSPDGDEDRDKRKSILTVSGAGV